LGFKTVNSMICKNIITNVEYDYSFDDEGNVILKNYNQNFTELYENWLDNYLIVDKWKKII